MRQMPTARCPAVRGTVLALLTLCSLAAAPAAQGQATASNFAFGQLDWYDESGTLTISNSSWGFVSFDLAGDAAQIYYLNVVAEAGSAEAWIVQNLPIFPQTINEPVTSEGADFDITLLGLSDGTDLSSLQYRFSVTPVVLALPLVGPMVGAVVADRVRLAFGTELGVGVPLVAANIGAPVGVRVRQGVTDVIQHRDVQGVQEDNSFCLYGSFARSIDWLNRTYKLGSNKTAQQIYDDIVKAAVPIGAGSYAKNVAKKDSILKRLDGTSATKILDLKNAIGPVSGVAEETGKDLLEWLRRELPTEDVELQYVGANVNHIVTLTGLYKSGDTTYVKYRDDEHQGDNTKGDAAEKHASLIKDANGDYVFRRKEGGAFGTVRVAISESVQLCRLIEPLGAPGNKGIRVRFRSSAKIQSVRVVNSKNAECKQRGTGTALPLQFNCTGAGATALDSVDVDCRRVDNSRPATILLEMTDCAGSKVRCDPVLATLSADVPEATGLDQSFPNPFTTTTTIPFRVAEAGRVTLTVYDLMGRAVITLVDADLPGGSYRVLWEGENAQGTPLAAGTYVYRLTTSTGSFAGTLTRVQ